MLYGFLLEDNVLTEEDHGFLPLTSPQHYRDQFRWGQFLSDLSDQDSTLGFPRKAVLQCVLVGPAVVALCCSLPS